MGRPKGHIKPRTEVVHFRLPLDLLEIVRKIGIDEERPVAAVCRRLLRTVLIEKAKQLGANSGT